MKMLTKPSTTVQGEKDRLSHQSESRSYFKRSIKYGTITEVHDKLYAVKVALSDGGGPVLAGEFIPITNPWQQLIHDFGELRPGLLVEIHYSGDQETSSTAKVIGLEGEKIAQLQEKPTANLAMYEIFSPGV